MFYAKEFLIEAYRINPVSPNICSSLGELFLYRFKEKDEAKKYFEACLKGDPNNEKVLSHLSKIYFEKGEKRETLKRLSLKVFEWVKSHFCDTIL